MMPLDTFANSVVESICGRTKVKLSLDGAGRDGMARPDSPQLAQARALFPGDKPHKFTAAELLFSWLIEPERWEQVPFLHAEHETLRGELLELPLGGEHGRLKYVSPAQLEGAMKFRERLGELIDEQRRAQEEGKAFHPTGVDKKVFELAEAHQLYRTLTFRPGTSLEGRDRLADRLAQAIGQWGQLERNLANLSAAPGMEPLDEPIRGVQQAVSALRQLVSSGDMSAEKFEPLVADFRDNTEKLAAACAALVAKMSDPPMLSPEQQKAFRQQMKLLANETEQLARMATEAHLAYYDGGNSLRLVPALNAAALEANRDTADDAQPWLNFEAVLYGSSRALKGYPWNAVEAVRDAFEKVKHAYTDRDNPQRTIEFNRAMPRFAAAVRTLGEKINPLREKLPIKNRDDDLMALTAYPPPGSTDLEVRYNQSNPFFWAWLIALGATLGYSLSFGVVRKPMFWLGSLLLVVALSYIVYGFAVRVIITGFAPVTNMFETVLFAALVAGLLGLWFALLPLLWPGISAAWRMTSLPLRRRVVATEVEPTGLFSTKIEKVARWLLLVPQAATAVALFYFLSWRDYTSASEESLFPLLPRTDVGASVPTISNVVVWLVGTCVLLFILVFVPRVAFTAVLSVFTVPYGWAKRGMSAALDQVMQRRPFAGAGAALAFGVALIGYYSPVFHSDIGSLMPVLRNNFWLTIHVLTITVSYGAGALAAGLGMLSLGYYLFGRYRDPKPVDESLTAEEAATMATATSSRRRPPEACATLAGFIYKAIQVAVLTLAAGTILGALWADVSWGRFWGWDPKEVWALVSLLVYMVILHGRYVNWFGNFGLTLGAVLGETAIVWAWYGVNYLLPAGLHSYGSGSGGQKEVLLAMAFVWVYVGAAAVRYLMETRRQA